MIKAKSSVKVNFPKLSQWLGKMEVTELRKPFKNEKSGEFTTKVVVLSRGENIEMYEVTVPGALDEKDLTVGEMIDFENAVVTFNARGFKSFDGIQSELNSTIRVDKLLRHGKAEAKA